MAAGQQKPRKVCFVTIGATAGFDGLLRAVLSPEVLRSLSDEGYSDIVVQYGNDGRAVFDQLVTEYKRQEYQSGRIDIQGFDFRPNLQAEMVAAKGNGERETEGVVVSHAGSGTILDALRIAVPLVVVPNPALLNNHQAELAEELASAGYAVHGKLDDLAEAVREVEALRQRPRSWPPTNSGQDPVGRGLAGVMDDEMGFVD